MRARLRFIFLLPLCAISSAQPPADLEARSNSFAKGQSGGVAIAWIDADGPTFFTTGTYSAEDARPITPDTSFEIGSISKVFTALLLAESERQGKVSRWDPAANYLLPSGDSARTSLAKITLLSLATHTSGLPRLPCNLKLNTTALLDPYATYDRAALVEAFRTEGSTAVAGQDMSYSNFGASVLGESLAVAWNTTFSEALQTRVLIPLELKATTVGLAGSPPPIDLAPAHGDNQAIVPNWTWQACAPCGGLRSTARDLAVFLAAYLGKLDTPLAPAMEATLVPQHTSPQTGGQIGLGWFLTDSARGLIAWHNGATAGSRAFAGFNRASGRGVIILSNQAKACEGLGFSLLSSSPSPPAAVSTPTNEASLPSKSSAVGRTEGRGLR